MNLTPDFPINRKRMEIEACQDIDLDFEAHNLIEHDHFSEDVTAGNEVGINTVVDVNEQLPELHESTEPERNQKREGVLDPEELSNMISGADTSEKPSLPGIQEEIAGSTESLSTLASDNLTLEACEDDLFLDIRASIQRSSKKASYLTSSSCKKAAVGVDSTAISSLKKEDSVSQDKNPKPSLKKASTFQTARISRSQPQPKQVGKLVSGKSVKQDSVHSQATSIAKVGETKPILPKPPKIISSSISSSVFTAKRDSLGTGRVKSECGSSKQGTVSSKVIQPSKVSMLSGTRKPFPKPAIPSKSSLMGSSTTGSVQSTRSSSSSDSSTNAFSGIPAKTTVMMARRNLVKSGGPSGSIAKAPSRAGPKNNFPASTLSAHMMSGKISPSVSPASSISEWSSASSSSLMANQRSNISRTSLDSSCTSVDGDNIPMNPRNHSTGPTAERNENRRVTLSSNTSKKSSTLTGTIQAPAKPSGLRMPTAKIGFFDVMKSLAHTPGGHKQSVFPKNEAATSIPVRSSNSNLKSAKVPTARSVASLANRKPASPKPASLKPASATPASPVSFQGNTHASTLLIDVNNFSTLSTGAMVGADGETCQKAEEVPADDGVEQVVGAGIRAIDKANLVDMSMHRNIDSGDIKAVLGKGINTSGSEYVDQRRYDALIQQNHLKKNHESCSIWEATEKENDKSGPSDPESETQDCMLSFPTAASESAVCRAPFAHENTPSSNECTVAPMPTSLKLASPKPSSLKPASPLSFGEKTHASTLLTVLNDSSSLSSGAMASVTGETCQKEEKVPVEDDIKQMVSAGANEKENLVDLSMYEKDDAGGEIKTVSGEGSNTSGSEYVDQTRDNVQIQQDHLKKTRESHQTCAAIEKENHKVGHSEPQKETPDCMLSFPTAALESAVCRAPFAPKNTPSKNEYTTSPMPASPRPTSPVSVQEKKHALTLSTDANDSSSLSPGVMARAAGEICQKAEKVPPEVGVVKQVVGAGIGDTDKENIVDLNMYKNMDASDIQTVSGEGSNTSGSEHVQTRDDVLIYQDHLKKNCESPSICEATEKENHKRVNSKHQIEAPDCTLAFPRAASEPSVCIAPVAPKNTTSSNEFTATPKSPSLEPVSPVSFQEKTHASYLPADVRDSSSLSPGATANASGETCQNTENVPVEDDAKQVVGAGICAIDKENLVDLSMNKSASGEATEKENDKSGHSEPQSETSDWILSFPTAASESAIHRVPSVPKNTPKSNKCIASPVPASPKLASPKPVFQEKTTHASTLYTDVSDSSSLSPGAMASAAGETCQKGKKVLAKDGDKQVVAASMHTIDKENIVDLNMHTNIDAGDIMIVSGKGSKASGSECYDQTRVDVLIQQDHLKKTCEPHPICKATKENDMKGDSEPQSETPDCMPCFPVAASESAACRAPLAPKNTPINNECVDIMLKDSAIQVAAADKTGFILLSSEQRRTSNDNSGR